MTLWAERQVKRDLGILVHRRKRQSFDKLFLTPPHVDYIAREAKTAARLRRLMGTNVVQLTDFVFMDKLEHQTVKAYREDLQERMDGRAYQAAQLAYLELWESVLRGQSSIPPEKLDDPCMRQVRQHQLKIEGLQQQAVKLKTTVQRVAAMPHVWCEPSRYKPPKRKDRSRSPPAAAAAAAASATPRSSKHSRRSRASGRSSRSTQQSLSAQAKDQRSVVRTDSWRSRQLVIKMSEEARERRSRSAGGAQPGHLYRHLADSDSEVCNSEKLKKLSSYDQEGPPPRRDRRLSRVNPPRRTPVVFPEQPPPFQLLSCDATVGRSVMKPLANTDFIIPRYFRPKAPNVMRAAKNLDELYAVGNAMFDSPYPSMDNHDWRSVVAERAEKKAEQEQEVPPVQTFRNV